ncbi:MAG: DNA-directed RNA polymerase subunit omega [Vicinamibacterales bacterium]
MSNPSQPPSRFEFVVTAGARARQLLAGSTPRVDVGNHKKVTIAKREVQTGAVERLPIVIPAPEAVVPEE